MGLIQPVLLFKGLYERQNVCRLNLGYRHGTDMRKNMLLQTMQQMGPSCRQNVDCLRFLPFQRNIFEGIGFFRFSGGSGRLFMLRWVYAVRKELFSLVALFTGLLQRDRWVLPETEELALLVEAIGHAPQLAAAGRNIEKQAASIRVFSGLFCGLQALDVGIGKHGQTSLKDVAGAFWGFYPLICTISKCYAISLLGHPKF